MARIWEPLLPCTDCGEIVKQLNRRMPQLYQSLATVQTRMISAIPDASPETTTVDGYASIFSAVGLSWSGIRTGSGNGADDTNPKLQVQIRCDGNVDKWDSFIRTITGFDLSALPTDATVISVALELNGQATGATDDFGGGSLVLLEATLASNTAVAAGDYENLGTTELAARITFAMWRAYGANTFYLNEDGLTLVQEKVGGVLNLGLKIGRDFDNDEPTWVSGNKTLFAIAASDNLTYRAPTLIVTYQE